MAMLHRSVPFTNHVDVAVTLAMFDLTREGLSFPDAANTLGYALARHWSVDGLVVARDTHDVPEPATQVMSTPRLPVHSPVVRSLLGVWVVGPWSPEPDYDPDAGWCVVPTTTLSGPWFSAWYNPEHDRNAVHFVYGRSDRPFFDDEKIETLTPDSLHRSWLRALDLVDVDRKEL